MAMCSSLLKQEEDTVDEITEHGEWLSAEYIDGLKRQKVKLWDILEIELSNDPPLYKWALVIGISESDLKIVLISSVEDLDPDDSFPDVVKSLNAVIISGCRVRINNERVHFPTNSLENSDEEVFEHSMLRIILLAMAYFLRNSSSQFQQFLKAIEEDFADVEESDDGVESMVKTLIEMSILLLLALANKDLEDDENKPEQNFGTVSDWFHKNDIKKSEFRFGDRLEFSRWGPGLYSHWGLCLGKLADNLLVLHFSLDRNGSQFAMKKISNRQASAEDKPAYHIDPIEKPLGNHRVRINNKRDGKGQWKPLDIEEMFQGIVGRLMSQSFQESPQYSALNNNCEHLVNGLRYKKHHCDQWKRARRFGGLIFKEENEKHDVLPEFTFLKSDSDS